MYISDGGPSIVIKGTVGSGGVAKGDLSVLSSNKFVKIADGASVLTVVAVALEAGAENDVVKFELVSANRIVTAKYTGSSKTSLTDADISKVFDVNDGQIVDLDDTSGGCAFCVGYDNDLDLIHFIVIPAQRTL